MGPGVFHELSRHLAVRLEKGLRAGLDAPIPVFLCHPLELLEGADGATGRAAGALYLYRIAPAGGAGARGLAFEPPESPGAPHRLRPGALWVTLRYAFLVVGGTLEDELGALARVLAMVHDRPWVSLGDIEAEPLEEDGDPLDSLDSPGSALPESVPLALLDDADVWREIGLGEHRLALAFEARVPVGGDRFEEVEPIVEREVDVRRRASSTERQT